MPECRRPWRPVSVSLPFTLALALAGCSEPVNGGKGQAAKKEPEDTFIVGKRTQDIRKIPDEQQKGGQVVQPRITSKDPITIYGNAYVSIIGQASMLAIQQAVDLYHATNDRYPKDHEEFMNEIIKANNISLPKLPSYQEYGYDEKEHKLVIIEYPEKKAAAYK